MTNPREGPIHGYDRTLMYRERRRYPRVDYRLPIGLKVVRSDGYLQTEGPSVSGVTVNISTGGAVARLDEVMPDITECIIRFYHAGDLIEPERTTGTVVRVERGGNGCLVAVRFDTPLEFLQSIDAPGRSPV